VSLASVRAEQGRDEEALALLRRAAEAEPDSGFPRSCLGAFYERKGDPERALAAYRASVEVEPSHAAGHAGIGRILLSRGEVAGACAAFEAALAADPDDVAVLLGAAEARERADDRKGAARLLERALVHAPDRGDLWWRLAGLYEAEERLEDAVAALWEARARRPELAPEAGARLRRLYLRLAEREAAPTPPK
jgi:tetratricopeptide (TPR) repeat protein